MLPDGWVTVPLEEIGSWGSGGTPKRTDSRFYSNGIIPWLVIGDLNDGVVTHAQTYITEEGLINSSAKLLPPNTLLFAMYGSIGKLGITGIECATNQAIAFCIPDKEIVELRYLFYALKNAKDVLNAQGQGVAQKNISQTILKAYRIPLAPRKEQKRIADKLDSLLARVDTCRDRLERIPIILEDFRQSVITLAMSGKLTENLRENEWENVALKDICLSISDGDHQAPPQVKQGVPFITIGAINDKHLDLNRAKRFVPYSYFEKLKDHQKPQFGDVLFSVTGSIAIPALVNTNESFVFQRHIAILKPDLSLVTSKFLFYLLCTAKIKNQAISVATGTAQKTIPLSKLRMFSANIPSIIEQHVIVSYIDTMMIYADRIEDSFKLAASHINCLTPSLLYKAYCGELVLQDPTDEPASVLLDRIRIMRETGESTFSKSQQRKPISDKSSQSMIVMLKRKNIQSSHLSDILKSNGSMGSEALWLASQLDIDDFYDQLKDEEENGLLKEQKEQSIDTPRFLESV
jgi:type I restriction enzyme S subunit